MHAGVEWCKRQRDHFTDRLPVATTRLWQPRKPNFVLKIIDLPCAKGYVLPLEQHSAALTNLSFFAYLDRVKLDLEMQV